MDKEQKPTFTDYSSLLHSSSSVFSVFRVIVCVITQPNWCQISNEIAHSGINYLISPSINQSICLLIGIYSIDPTFPLFHISRLVFFRIECEIIDVTYSMMNCFVCVNFTPTHVSVRWLFLVTAALWSFLATKPVPTVFWSFILSFHVDSFTGIPIVVLSSLFLPKASCWTPAIPLSHMCVYIHKHTHTYTRCPKSHATRSLKVFSWCDRKISICRTQW
jgi:hypothetical protein